MRNFARDMTIFLQLFLTNSKKMFSSANVIHINYTTPLSFEINTFLYITLFFNHKFF